MVKIRESKKELPPVVKDYIAESVKDKGGHPTDYKPEIVSYICSRMIMGEPLARICREQNMPDDDTVRLWQSKYPQVAEEIARARDQGYDALAEQCLQIADDESFDWVMTKKGIVTDEVAISRARLQVDTRLKLLAKWNPKKYGDGITLRGDKENPLFNMASAMDAIAARMRNNSIADDVTIIEAEPQRLPAPAEAANVPADNSGMAESSIIEPAPAAPAALGALISSK